MKTDMKTVLQKILKRYRIFLLALAVMGVLVFFNRLIGMKALSISVSTFRGMLYVLPPVFILLGLLDVWVPRATMVRFMGEGSGLKGILLAILIGSAAAGPLYGAFPVAAVFMKKGVKFSNVLIFLGAWSTTKIPMLLFEMSALGVRFAVVRLLVDIPGIIIIAAVLSRITSKEEQEKIYRESEKMIK